MVGFSGQSQSSSSNSFVFCRVIKPGWLLPSVLCQVKPKCQYLLNISMLSLWAFSSKHFCKLRPYTASSLTIDNIHVLLHWCSLKQHRLFAHYKTSHPPACFPKSHAGVFYSLHMIALWPHSKKKERDRSPVCNLQYAMQCFPSFRNKNIHTTDHIKTKQIQYYKL